MKKLLESLWKDYEDVSEQIECVDKDNPIYEKLLEDRDKVRNELFKLEQLDSENKREKTRNTISIVTFIVTTLVGIWTVLKTFKFDQESTVTSTLGRTSLTNIVSRMFKR